MKYHVGWNMPGYLPETELTCFEEESAALQYLQSEARSLADGFYDYHTFTCVRSEEESDKSCDCEAYQEYLNACGLSSAIQDRDFREGSLYMINNYVYWVMKVNDCECEDVYLSPVW